MTDDETIAGFTIETLKLVKLGRISGVLNKETKID